MLNFALQYLRMGLCVLPAIPGRKWPRIKWKEFQKRLPTEQELTGWWTKWPDSNIALVTGKISGIAALDFDGPIGLKFKKDNRLTARITVISPRDGGGMHLWYRYQEGLKNSASKIAEKVDLRADRGIIMLPPSVHKNGKRYRWLNPLRSVSQLENFPASLLNSATAIVQENRRDKEESWIAKALQEMKLGNIDDTLTSVCGRLRHDGYSMADARVLLLPHASQAGATDGHLEEKIENVWSRYEAKKSVTVVENEEAESVSDFLAVEEEPVWIVPGILSKPSIAFCVGLPESSKTWLLMDLAIEAARGGDWLGLFPVGRTKTLFIDQERPRAETKRRLNALLSAKGLRRSDMDNLFLKSGSSIKIDMESSYSAFQRLLEKIQPGLVIVDSLATFHGKEENSRMDIQIVMEKIKKLREQFNCTFLFIHHANKFAFQAASEGKEPTIGEMAGSIALPAAAETVLTVQKTKGGGSTVFHTKSTQALKTSPFGIIVEDVDKGIRVRGVK